MRRHALVLAALAGACANPTGPSLALRSSAAEAPADGLTRVHLEAAAAGLPDAAVVSFEVAGPGLLSATHARVQDGQARADLYAPFEEELADLAVATVTARAVLGEQPLVSSADIRFTIPTEGAPVLSARTVPDRVRAGSGETLTLVLEGRRLTDGQVTLQADGDLVPLPPSVELIAEGARFRAEIAIPAPATAGEVRVAVAGGGANPVEVVLHFVGADDATFDVSGTFAEVSYGIMRIGGLIFLDPDPQCLVAPTFTLVRQEQDGDRITMTREVCDIEIPTVNIVFIGGSETWVDPSFVTAINEHAGPPLVVTAAADGALTADPSSLGVPSIVGAELADPEEAMPTAGDDPRVRDHDGDGNPGVTIHNSSQGDQFTATRSRTTAVTGRVLHSDAIDGSIAGESESVVFNGGSGGLAPTVENFPSPFHARRIDGRNGAPNIAPRDGDASSISCADVKAYAAELLAQAPGPDTASACR